MNRNPILNALLASVYIALVASFITSLPQLVGPDEQKSVLNPIAMLSLLTLSVAVMGYLFCYQPIQLLVEGKKGEATQLFLKTLGSFALLTLIAFGAVVLSN